MWLVEQRLGLANLEDGTAVRFAVVGTGPIAIYVPGWVSHLELGWALPAEREFYEGLADGRTLVRYDRPGCGLSGTTDRADVVELELEVLQAGRDRGRGGPLRPDRRLLRCATRGAVGRSSPGVRVAPGPLRRVGRRRRGGRTRRS